MTNLPVTVPATWDVIVSSSLIVWLLNTKKSKSVEDSHSCKHLTCGEQDPVRMLESTYQAARIFCETIKDLLDS
jgi:hypothetical protein